MSRIIYNAHDARDNETIIMQPRMPLRNSCPGPQGAGECLVGVCDRPGRGRQRLQSLLAAKRKGRGRAEPRVFKDESPVPNIDP